MNGLRYSPPYSGYAQVYDRIGQRAFGERMATVVLALLSARGFAPVSVLDLGCGTGAATLSFARSGLRAVGVDVAPDMLDIAREVAASEGIPVAFLEADMRGELPLSGSFDLVTCIYDAFNYLPDETAVETFLQVAFRHLRPAGYLVFDMNTRSRLTNPTEQGVMVAGDSDDFYVTYRSWFDPTLDASPLVMTAFVRDDADCWIRYDEEHIERAWPIEDIATRLLETGFQVHEVLGYVDVTGEVQRPATENHGRVVFVASR